MNFLYPQFLFAFGVLVIPILLHLFHLRRFKTFYFSNVAFLKELDTTSKSTRKVKQLIVLILRLLAFSALIFAFAQPYFPSEAQIDSNKPEVRVFFIDNSQSMSANGVEGELLSQAKNMARELILKDNPGAKYLIFSNHFAADEMCLMSQPDAINYIDKLTFSNSSKQSDLIWPLVQNILDEENVTGTLVVLSDAQINQWKPFILHNIDYPISFVKLAQTNSNNVSIDSMWTSKPIYRQGSPFDLSLKITNHSESDINSISVKVSLNDNIQQFTAEFDGEKETVLTINYVSPEIGFHSITSEIEDEQVFFDDILYGSFQVKSHLNVGVISEGTTTSNIGLVYSLDAFHKLNEWNSQQIPFQLAGEMELLILNQLKRVDPALKQVVTTLLEQGKTVVMIPSQETDLSSWNDLLATIEMPIIQATDTSTASINNIQISHAFFSGMFDNSNPKIQIPTKRRTKLNASISRSISLLSYSDGSPFLSTSTKRGQSCFVFNSDLNNTNQNLLSSDLFSALFLRIAENAGVSVPLYHINGTVGQFSIPYNENNESPAIIENTSIQFIPRQQKQNGILTIFFSGGFEEQILSDGIYNVTIDKKSIGKIALNYNRDESNIQTMSVDEIVDDYANAGIDALSVKQMDESSQILSLDTKKSDNLWRILLILALAFFIAEILVVKFWKN